MLLYKKSTALTCLSVDVDTSSVVLELLCATRRAMSVQIKFTIALESDALSTSAVTSLETASSSAQLANTFSEQAAARNEVTHKPLW